MVEFIKKFVGKSWADKRLKQVILGAGANVISTVLSFLVFFISVPLTIDYLGPERFGVWMAIASLTAMLRFMDFGVSNGLVSQVAKKNTSSNKQSLQNIVSNGLITLSLIGVLVGTVIFLLNKFYPLVNILKIDSLQAKSDADHLIIVFIIFFTLSIPLNGIYKILLGLQRNWIVHATRSIASIISLILLVVLAKYEAPPHHLLLATFGVQVSASAVLLPYFVRQKLITYKSLTDWHSFKNEYKSLLNIGGLFLILQLGMMAGWGADALIISSLASVSAVAQFAVVHRLYQFVTIPVTIINTPLWGAFADAYARNDLAFIRRTLKISLLLSLLMSGLIGVTILLFSEYILKLWIGDELNISYNLIVGFTVWKILESVGHSLSMALNGMHIIKPQVISVVFLCAIVLPLKFIYTPIYGPSAVIWSTVIAYSISTLLFYLVYFRREIRKELSIHFPSTNQD